MKAKCGKHGEIQVDSVVVLDKDDPYLKRKLAKILY